MFVVVSEFTVPGQSPQRLMALQRITGDLDAVELKAWQDMVHVLTHEMMNSLTPISSLVGEPGERCCDGAGGSTSPAVADEVAGALEAIKRRSLGLMGFVDRYRTVAELPAPKRQVVSMERLLSGIDRLLGPALREKGVDYRTSITPPELSIDADPQLLEQAMINLLRNAADAVVGVDHPRIDVTCELRDGQVVLAVARQRRGRARRSARSDFRAVLHDQGGRLGHRAQPGAAHRARARRAARAASQLAARSGVRSDVEQESRGNSVRASDSPSRPAIEGSQYPMVI